MNSKRTILIALSLLLFSVLSYSSEHYARYYGSSFYLSGTDGNFYLSPKYTCLERDDGDIWTDWEGCLDYLPEYLLAIPSSVTARDIDVGTTVTGNIVGISSYAFGEYYDNGSYHIEALELPSTINSISSLPSGLLYLKCAATTPPTLSSDVTIPSTCTIYVPSTKLTTYKSNTYWKAYASQMVGYTSTSSSVTSISITGLTSPMYIGETYSCSATVTPSTATNKTVQWRCTDPSIATISSNGVITPVSQGHALIIAESTDGSHVIASRSFTVVDETVTFKSSVSKMVTGQSFQFTASVTPSTHDQTITWSSSNNSVISIDGNGNAHALAKGFAYIYAESSSGETSSKYVTVSLVSLNYC